MSYEDIEEARVKRAAKEQAAADKGKRGRKRAAEEQATDKGKRGRKRKSPAPKADTPEPRATEMWINEALEAARAPAVWMSGVQVAPVARMY